MKMFWIARFELDSIMDFIFLEITWAASNPHVPEPGKRSLSRIKCTVPSKRASGCAQDLIDAEILSQSSTI